MQQVVLTLGGVEFTSLADGTVGNNPCAANGHYGDRGINLHLA